GTTDRAVFAASYETGGRDRIAERIDVRERVQFLAQHLEPATVRHHYDPGAGRNDAERIFASRAMRQVRRVAVVDSREDFALTGKAGGGDDLRDWRTKRSPCAHAPAKARVPSHRSCEG